jgi:hypothetical protein
VPALDTAHDVPVTVDDPQRSEVPVETLADCPEDGRTRLGKRDRLRQSSGGGQVRHPSLFRDPAFMHRGAEHQPRRGDHAQKELEQDKTLVRIPTDEGSEPVDAPPRGDGGGDQRHGTRADLAHAKRSPDHEGKDQVLEWIRAVRPAQSPGEHGHAHSNRDHEQSHGFDDLR